MSKHNTICRVYIRGHIANRRNLTDIDIIDRSKGHASLDFLKFCMMACFKITWNWLCCVKLNVNVDKNTFSKNLKLACLVLFCR